MNNKTIHEDNKFIDDVSNFLIKFLFDKSVVFFQIIVCTYT